MSGVTLTYPDKTDWMAKPGTLHAKGKYLRGSSVINYTITYDKSKYYSSSLKYFDTWICENNYCEMPGTLGNIKEQPSDVKKYYYCHSAYGILLNGYGVCEGYARAMSRLLNAVVIPNLYVPGYTSGGFHAWNYVQMPDEKWYLTGSTWNDSTNLDQTWSRDAYLLISDDGDHSCRYIYDLCPGEGKLYRDGCFDTVLYGEAEYRCQSYSILSGHDKVYGQGTGSCDSEDWQKYPAGKRLYSCVSYRELKKRQRNQESSCEGGLYGSHYGKRQQSDNDSKENGDHKAFYGEIKSCFPAYIYEGMNFTVAAAMGFA